MRPGIPFSQFPSAKPWPCSEHPLSTLRRHSGIRHRERVRWGYSRLALVATILLLIACAQEHGGSETRLTGSLVKYGRAPPGVPLRGVLYRPQGPDLFRCSYTPRQRARLTEQRAFRGESFNARPKPDMAYPNRRKIAPKPLMQGQPNP